MPRNKRDGDGAPGVTDDQEKGYLVGSRWWDITSATRAEYVCLDKTTGAAVWIKTTSTGGADSFATIQVDGVTQNVGVPTLDFNGTDFTIAETPDDDFDITINPERIQDIIGGMGATTTGISVFYDDAGNAFTYVVSDTTVASDLGSTSLTPGDTLTIDGGSGVSTAVVGDTLTISVDHDNADNYDGNDHIDHTTIDLTAGVGLSGGGTIDANRTFTVDLNELTTETTIASGDFLTMVDITDSGSGKITFANLEGTIDHGNLAGLGTDDDHTQYVLKSLFDAQTVLGATADDTPAAITLAAQTLLGRVTGGNVAAIPIGITDNDIVQIDSADAGSGEYARFTANGLEGRTPDEVSAEIDHTKITNIGNTTHAYLDSHMDYYNGTFLESFRLAVTSDGATITGTLDKNPTGNLTQRFSDGYTTYTSSTVTITPGTATVPAKRFIYILQSDKATLVEGAAWPTTEHIKVAEVVVQTAALVNTDGILANRNWNDHAEGGSNDTPPNQGHHSHAWQRLRYDHSAYESGGVLTWAADGPAATLDFSIAAAVIYQMHPHTTDAFNTTTPGKFLVPNHPTAYTSTADIETLLTDSIGGSLTNRYYNVVIWGTVSSGSEQEQIFVNLPSGSYVKLGDATEDVSGYDVFTIPAAYKGYAYLIQRTTLRNQTDSAWTVVQKNDLRGQIPSIIAGGGTTANTTEFADLQFKIFDAVDPTALATFDATTIATGTTRTFTFPDASGTLVIAGSASHDGFSDFVTNEHIDWTSTASNFNTSGTAATGVLTVTGTVSISGASSLTLGTASSATGGLIIKNATNANDITINSGVTTTSYTLTLPLVKATAGQYLYDSAGDGVLSWNTPAGSGDVSKVGTPVNNQIGVWTGDGTIEGTTALTFDNSDLILYEAVSDGSPSFTIGSATGEKLVIQSFYASGTQQVEYVNFTTHTISGTADRGEFRFNVDETLIATIDDGGIELASGKVYDIAGTSVLSATTLGSTVVNSSLTSVGTIGTGVWQGTAINVTYGGTGKSTFTDGGILLGATTGAIEVTDTGTAGSATLPDEFLHAKGGTTNPDYKGIEQKVSITIETPVTGDNITISVFDVAATIREVSSLCTGGTSVAWNLYHSATRTTESVKVFTSDVTTNAGTQVTNSTPTSDGTISNTDPAQILFIDLTTVTGAVTQFHVTVRYTTT